MTVSELVCKNIGDRIEVNPLLKLGGLDLGGVELILDSRVGNTSEFVAEYLGVHIGNVIATISGDIIQWGWLQ